MKGCKASARGLNVLNWQQPGFLVPSAWTRKLCFCTGPTPGVVRSVRCSRVMLHGQRRIDSVARRPDSTESSPTHYPVLNMEIV